MEVPSGRGVHEPDPALAVEARGLRKVFRRGTVEKTAVDGVDLRVPRGHITGLIGPNGAGKSTLVAMLATLMRPTAGDAWIAGHSVVSDARGARLALSFNASAGERGFYWRLNGFQNLEFFAALQGLDARSARDRARWCLQRVGLEPDMRLRFGEFSSGMKRRMNVARALLVDRPIYLFDEPTSGVDPHSGEVIRTILRDLRADGRTVVLVTHDMGEVTELCDEVVMLYGGKSIRQDSPEQLRRRVRTTAIEVEVAELSQTDAVATGLRRLPEVEEVTHSADGRLRVSTADPESDVRALLRWAAAGSVPVSGVSIVRPRLEDAFVSLVEEATGEAAELIARQLAAPTARAPRHP